MKKISEVNYKKANRLVKPIKGKYDIPEGSWFPISIVSHITGLSGQTIRLLYLSKQIDGLKFPVGPMLINLDQVEELHP